MADGIDKAGADRASQASAETQAETARVIALAIATAIAQLRRRGGGEPAQDRITVEGEGRKPLVKIKVGGRNVFVGRPGEEPLTQLASEEMLEKIQTAIAHPEQYKGVFSIQVDGEVVYRVQNGQVRLQAISQQELQQAVASVFDNFQLSWDGGLREAEGKQADAVLESEISGELGESVEVASQSSGIEVSPEAVIGEVGLQSDAVPVESTELSVEEISQSIQQELVDLRQRVQSYEERLSRLEGLVSSGQLVPVSEAASQALVRVDDRQGIVTARELLNGVTAIAKDAARQVGTQVQVKREQLTERFSRNVVQPIQLAKGAAMTKLAAVALNSLGHGAFVRAATADVLQKASLLTHVEGESRNGARVWANEQYEVQYGQSSLVVTDREGDRGQILAMEGRSVKHNSLQLRDVALIGEAGIGAAQVLAAARRAHAAINGDREQPEQRKLMSANGR